MNTQILPDKLSKLSRDNPKKSDENLIQLSFQFSEKTRPVSNAVVRAALFAAIQGENRAFFNKAVIASQDGIKIVFTGQQFNQDDHDVFMQLVFMASHKPLGESVTVSANAILAGLGRGTGKSQHEQLKNEIHRLVTGTVNIKCNGINFIGHLIDSAVQDENLPSQKRHWNFRLSPEMVGLFSPNQFTLIDWEQRKTLKRKDLARWLHLYFASHSRPFPVSVEFLRDKSGSKTKELWKFRENLKKSLNSLKEIGFFSEWMIDSSDVVHIQRVNNEMQIERHKTADNQPELPFHCPTEWHLKPVTIEKFRGLYPRFDPYVCKTDFEIWLTEKTLPKNYDAAFLGFAKKWVIGKF